MQKKMVDIAIATLNALCWRVPNMMYNNHGRRLFSIKFLKEKLNINDVHVRNIERLLDAYSTSTNVELTEENIKLIFSHDLLEPEEIETVTNLVEEWRRLQIPKSLYELAARVVIHNKTVHYLPPMIQRDLEFFM